MSNRPGCVPMTDTLEALFNRANVEALYARLSADLGIHPPVLKWTERSRNGYYRPRGAEVTLGPRTWRAWHCAIHEYAHHVARELGCATAHDGEFREALRMVAGMVLGDPDRYAWRTEYPSIRKWHGRTPGVLSGSRATVARKVD